MDGKNFVTCYLYTCIQRFEGIESLLSCLPQSIWQDPLSPHKNLSSWRAGPLFITKRHLYTPLPLETELVGSLSNNNQSTFIIPVRLLLYSVHKLTQDLLNFLPLHDVPFPDPGHWRIDKVEIEKRAVGSSLV